MSIYVTDEEKRQLLESRLRSFAIDSYGHELNKATSGGNPETITEANNALAILAESTTVYEAELASLVDTSVVAPTSLEYTPVDALPEQSVGFQNGY